MKSMEVDDESNGTTSGTRETTLHLRPVAPEESGEGLPYAPVDWPKPGDTWAWRTGRRVTITGHYVDRYLYPPRHLRRLDNSTRRTGGFASKLSVERYIRSAFPGADIEAFFASFSWKIPSKQSLIHGNVEGRLCLPIPSEETEEHYGSDSQSDGVHCKAGNKKCNSLLLQATKQPLAAMPCEICCSEPSFCRDCCCILCCKNVNSNYGGYSYIKCETMVSEGYMCGHVAHINCALRTYMAGTVGGSIGLDAEYYCRRCDAKTDLIPHGMKLLQTCKSIDSREEMEKILNVGLCISRGSQKPSVKGLLNIFEYAITKLKCGTILEDIWKVQEAFSAISTDVISLDGSATTLEVTKHEDPLDDRTNMSDMVSMTYGCQAETLKLEDEIDQVLQALQKSQEFEYKIAEERLHAQKKYLQDLCQQLKKERSELARCTKNANPNALLNAILNRKDQIKKELTKLKEMEQVANGFGRTSKSILKEHFGLEIEQ